MTIIPLMLNLLVASIAGATPLIYAATGELMVQRSGVVNVGIEGIMLMGAFIATLTTYFTHSPIFGVFVAAISGILLACLLAFLTLKIGADQVVIGVVINLFSLGLTGTLYQILFSNRRAITHQLPMLFHSLPVMSLFTLPCIILVWWVMQHTRTGLEIKACGEQPDAADAAGINVLLTRTLTLLFAGALAGISGAYLSVGNSNIFAPAMTAGRGFIALAIVTAGRWNPWGCLIAALVFGFTDSLQFEGQALGLDSHYRYVLHVLHLYGTAGELNLTHLPYQLFLALPYVVTLFLLIGSSRTVAAPANLGRVWRRN